MAEHQGRNEAVVTGKVLKAFHKDAIVWDVERGAPDAIQPKAWQTCTCIGSWHYDKRRLYDGSYKSAQAVIQMLADVVSKNGNLLLSVPVKGDGTIDSLEYKIVKEIGAWLKVNGRRSMAHVPGNSSATVRRLRQRIRLRRKASMRARSITRLLISATPRRKESIRHYNVCAAARKHVDAEGSDQSS